MLKLTTIWTEISFYHIWIIINYKKYISSKVKKIDFNDEEIDFLENILQYKNDILNESDILIIAQIMRNILDDFSYEFGYINNEDVYDRVFSNFYRKVDCFTWNITTIVIRSGSCWC